MSQTDIFRGVETTAIHSDGIILGIYRGTTVASKKGNSITLQTGGWRSRTTKTRMNQFSNNFVDRSFGVFQLKGAWFVVLRRSGTVLPFFSDSITFEV